MTKGHLTTSGVMNTINTAEPRKGGPDNRQAGLFLFPSTFPALYPVMFLPPFLWSSPFCALLSLPFCLQLYTGNAGADSLISL